MPSVNRVPNDVASDTEQRYAENSDEEESDDNEENEEGEEAESSPSKTAPGEARTKRTQDPSAHLASTQVSGAPDLLGLVPSVRSSKRGRAETVEPIERIPKQEKQATIKP